MSKLVYCATPSRLKGKTIEIMDFVTSLGKAPLHPFQALPYERYEGNPKIGREKSMEYCFRLVDICDEFYMFGISRGALDEVNRALKLGKPIEPHFEFDPDWQGLYAELKWEYGNPLNNFM